MYFPSTKVSIIVFAEELYSIPVASSILGGYYSGSVVLVLCTGNELNLTQCSTGSGTHQCNDHSQDASVRCMYETQCESYSLRLIPENDQTAQHLYLSKGNLSSYYLIDDEIHREEGRKYVWMGNMELSLL